LQAQAIETFNPADDLDPTGPPRLNLITLVKVEKANQGDSSALIPAVDELVRRGLAPDELMADTAYGSDANFAYAASNNIELVAPVPGTGPGRGKRGKGLAKLAAKAAVVDDAQTASFAAGVETVAGEPEEAWQEPIGLSDFSSKGDGVIEACPMGQAAGNQRHPSGKGGRAYFDHGVCMRCRHAGFCPVRMTKSMAWLSYQDEDVRSAKRRGYQETGPFKKRYRKRSGIEGTNSQLARIGLKRLRVRGQRTASLKIHFKALALNVIRIIRFEEKIMPKVRPEAA
jgi:hypothetical protein